LTRLKSGAPLPAGLWDICLGPDGNIWGTANSGGGIDKITPDGKVTSYLALHSDPLGISVGSNHHLWFAEGTTGRIAQITLNGKITSYKVPVPKGKVATPNWTAPGPDGRTWFVDQGTAPGFGAVTADGKVTVYKMPANAVPTEIVAGADGNLWITDRGLNAIDVVSTSGKFLATHHLSTANAEPWGIIVGPDKNMWIAEEAADAIVRMTTSGAEKAFPVPTADGAPLNLADGPDGNVWFNETGATFQTAGKIGYVTPNGSLIRDFPIDLAGGSASELLAHVHNLAFDANHVLWFSSEVLITSHLGKFVY
jgi:virginiamycin B lyase